MRPPQKSNRARGRGNRKGGGGGGNNINRVYESAGPEGKVRGTPQQIVDKYLSLARDAQTSGDRVTAENFLQHAEHYQRILTQAMGTYEERRDSTSSDQDDDEEGPSGDYARFERAPQPETPQPPAQRQPAAAPEGRADPQPAGDAALNGLTTIDTSDDGAPDLLVATKEMEASASQPRRRRTPRTRRAAAETGDAKPAKDDAPVEQGKAEAD